MNFQFFWEVSIYILSLFQLPAFARRSSILGGLEDTSLDEENQPKVEPLQIHRHGRSTTSSTAKNTTSTSPAARRSPSNNMWAGKRSTSTSWTARNIITTSRTPRCMTRHSRDPKRSGFKTLPTKGGTSLQPCNRSGFGTKTPAAWVKWKICPSSSRACRITRTKRSCHSRRGPKSLHFLTASAVRWK